MPIATIWRPSGPRWSIIRFFRSAPIFRSPKSSGEAPSPRPSPARERGAGPVPSEEGNSVPSPLAGEGQDEGWPTHQAARVGARHGHHPRLWHAACAAAVAAARTGRTGRRVAVELPGGTLFIEWREADDHILMTGPTEFEFEGELHFDGGGQPGPGGAAAMSVEVISFGCRLNTFESEVAKKLAEEAGLDSAVIVNTCAVTAEAVRQARQAIRKARRERPGAKIIVTGCAAQIEPDTFAEMAEADHVIGNAEKTDAATFLDIAGGALARVKVNDIASVRETAQHMVAGFGGRARAYVEVQNGCDHRCTFCVIPYGRGPSRSVPAGDVGARRFAGWPKRATARW